jgi:hypothetical protein
MDESCESGECVAFDGINVGSAIEDGRGDDIASVGIFVIRVVCWGLSNLLQPENSTNKIDKPSINLLN